MYYLQIMARYQNWEAPSGGPNSRTAKIAASRERELGILIQAMRKLREGLVASSRSDEFAQNAYVFIVRATIQARHMESYHPALLHLLHRLHPIRPLSHVLLFEFVNYYILDLACRQADLAKAFAIREAYGFRDQNVDKVLRAMVTGNWQLFWRTKRKVDVRQRFLMEYAEERIGQQVVQCISRAYLKADKDYIERATNRTLDELLMKHQVGWELNGDTLIIRKTRHGNG